MNVPQFKAIYKEKEYDVGMISYIGTNQRDSEGTIALYEGTEYYKTVPFSYVELLIQENHDKNL